MSLLDLARADLRSIMSDAVSGFAQPITLTSPDGLTAVVNGIANVIGTTIDPQTGVAVAGRRASVSLNIDALAAAGIGQPRGISDPKRKPWIVQFTMPSGAAQVCKVETVLPDELGCLICLLEAYKP